MAHEQISWCVFLIPMFWRTFMIRVVLSPSKAMDFEKLPLTQTSTTPMLLERVEPLIDVMQQKSVADIASLMKLSDKLSQLNYDRFQHWGSSDEALSPSKQALFAFTGDTYKDIPLEAYSEEDLDEAQARVRILSGLYGLLRPLDLISPYRLEMGTRLATSRGKSLYDYWGDEVQRTLLEEFEHVPENERFLVNCASNEYFKVLSSPGEMPLTVIEPIFKDRDKKGEFKVISFYAKRARGMMADFIVRERVEDVKTLEEFDRGGYAFDAASSTTTRPVFLRG